MADYWPGAVQVNMGGSVEGVESGVSEFERDDTWTEEMFTGGEWTTVEPRRKFGRYPAKVDVSRMTSQARMIRSGGSINSIDKPGVSFAPSEINGVSAKDGWERISVQIDSGAIDTVAPKEVAASFPVRRTKASRMGMGYVAANGNRIENHGERLVQGFTDDGTGIAMAMHVTDVKRTLGSVYRMNQAGNRVVLDGDESYMVHKKSGIVTPITVENGKFLFNIWIENSTKDEKDESAGRKSQEGRSRNAFAALAEEELEESPKPNTGFNWRDEIF